MEKFDQITETQKKQLGVQALADRPNASTSQYGQSGLTATQLKLWFDRLGAFLCDHINRIYESLENGEFSRRIGVSTDEEGIVDLQTVISTFVKDMDDGGFANTLRLYCHQGAEELLPLQQVVYDMHYEAAQKHEEIWKYLQDIGCGYNTAELVYIEDGGDTSVDVDLVGVDRGSKLIFTFRNAKGETGKSTFIRYSENADGTDLTEEWNDGQNYIGFATADTAPTDKAAYRWCEFTSLRKVEEALDEIIAIQETLYKKEDEVSAALSASY